MMTDKKDITTGDDRERLTLRKSAKLRHRSLVKGIFESGKNVYCWPLRAMCRPLSESELTETFRDHVPDRIGKVQIMVTVPKKKRRHAVDRVLMRRRIREAFRLRRRDFEKAVNAYEDIRTFGIAIIYVADRNITFSDIDRKMEQLLRKIATSLTPGPQSAASGPKTETSQNGTEP